MVEVGEETDEILVVRSSLHFSGVISASERPVPRGGPLFYLTGNHVHVVLLALEILTLMRLVKE